VDFLSTDGDEDPEPANHFIADSPTACR